ncbi:MAG: signal peptidase I [Geobacter sp.]|nr:signal peptidase I [Geobacter sp.]
MVASPTFGIGVLVAALLFLLVIIASCWKMYEKAGVAGWKAIVPIYNMYVLVQIAGKPWWWFLLMFVPVVGVVIALLVSLSLAERFGKGTLFGIGLFLLGFIFIPVLAFGKARYA